MPVAAKHQQAPLDFGTMTAGEITSAILAYLTTQDYTVWRQNTTGIYDPDTKRWRVARRTAKLTLRAAAVSPTSSGSTALTAFSSVLKEPQMRSRPRPAARRPAEASK